jgi:streptogramin lyase
LGNNSLVTRDETAAFIIRALYPTGFTCNGGANCATETPYFKDVPATDSFFPYVQKLYELGITTGCGNSDYCPSQYVTRDQAAAFLSRAFLGMPPFFTYAVGHNPSGIAIDASGNVWVTNAGDSTVTELLYNSSQSGPSWSPNPSGPFKIMGDFPSGIAIDASGNVWVANQGNNTVTELSYSGAPIGTYSVGNSPCGIVIDASSNVWVTLRGEGISAVPYAAAASDTVIKLTLVSGQPSISSFTVGVGPYGIAIDASGNVWVANDFDGTVTELSSLGPVLGTFLTLDKSSSPSNIAIDSAGNVWVTIPGANTVTKLSSSGAVIGTYTAGNNPYGIAIDASGNVWVTNAGDNTVAEYSPINGATLVNTFTVGDYPESIAIDSMNNVWVANTFGNSVTVWLGAASGQQFRPYAGPVWP